MTWSENYSVKLELILTETVHYSSRWTMRIGYGPSKAVYFRKTIKTGSVSFSGDHDQLPCSVRIR